MRTGCGINWDKSTPGLSPVKAEAALLVEREVLGLPMENRVNWTLPRLPAEIEERTGHSISRSRLSVVLGKKGLRQQDLSTSVLATDAGRVPRPCH